MIESVFVWRKEKSARDLDYSKDPDHCLTSMFYKNKDSDGLSGLLVKPHYI